MNANLIKYCEGIMLEKVKYYESDFYEYDMPLLKMLQESDRAILMLRDTGTYLALEKDFHSRDDWEFYRKVIDNWEDQTYLFINLDSLAEKNLLSIDKKFAIELVNEFYRKHLTRAIASYDRQIDAYYDGKVEYPDMKKFGLTDGELYYYGTNEFEKLLDIKMTSRELELVIPY